MTIESAVMHSIHRLDGQKNISLELSDTELNDNDLVNELFLQFKLGFQKRNTRSFGLFDVESRSNMADVSKLIKEDDADLIALSQDLAEKLKQFLSESDSALAGHLFFVKERVELKEFLWLFWVEVKDQYQFNADSNQPEMVQVMDSSRMNYAFKIDYSDWLEKGTNKFLSLLVPRGTNEQATAFRDFTAFEQGIDQTKQTQEFLNVVDQYVDDMAEPEAKEYKAKVMDFVIEQDAVGEPVVIEQLAQAVEESEPTKFSNFVADKLEEPVEEIQTDRASLKRYLRFSGRDQDMSISFAAERFGDGVSYDASNEALVIKALPKSLKQQLKKFLED